MKDLNSRLLAAHATGDHSALVLLYQQAAHQADLLDAHAFFLTQAYIFALEIGHPDTVEIRRQLIKMGREIQE